MSNSALRLATRCSRLDSSTFLLVGRDLFPMASIGGVGGGRKEIGFLGFHLHLAFYLSKCLHSEVGRKFSPRV